MRFGFGPKSAHLPPPWFAYQHLLEQGGLSGLESGGCPGCAHRRCRHRHAIEATSSFVPSGCASFIPKSKKKLFQMVAVIRQKGHERRHGRRRPIDISANQERSDANSGSSCSSCSTCSFAWGGFSVLLDSCASCFIMGSFRLSLAAVKCEMLRCISHAERQATPGGDAQKGQAQGQNREGAKHPTKPPLRDSQAHRPVRGGQAPKVCC